MFKKAKPLKKPEDFDHAYNYALFLLNLRLRTEGEMRKKMSGRGYVSSITDQVVKKLQDEKFIDDNRFAEIFIENMKSYKYYGFMMMKKKLFEKLLPKDLIESKLNELLTIEDEQAIAKRYVEKEFGDIKKVNLLPYEQRQKIRARLASRGFRVNATTGLV